MTWAAPLTVLPPPAGQRPAAGLQPGAVPDPVREELGDHLPEERGRELKEGQRHHVRCALPGLGPRAAPSTHPRATGTSTVTAPSSGGGPSAGGSVHFRLPLREAYCHPGPGAGPAKYLSECDLLAGRSAEPWLPTRTQGAVGLGQLRKPPGPGHKLECGPRGATALTRGLSEDVLLID